MDVAVTLFAGELGTDHPGVRDEGYRARRSAIAAIAGDYRRGAAVPQAPYADEEHDVWRLVAAQLRDRHERFAATPLVAAADRLGLPDDHIPQLVEVSALLAPLSGFRYEPVAGLVSPRDFYSALGDGWFRSTQYIRHASAPFYTPEPDVIHEVVGHATHLADPTFARLYREVGAAIARCADERAVQFLSRVFWFTFEFGVLREGRDLKAYGAGLLSSVGELETFADAEVRPLDVVEMGLRAYDITRYQPVLYAADSFAHLADELDALLDGYDDDAYARLAARG
jgi:phenylalanine-4-hydroxylase